MKEMEMRLKVEIETIRRDMKEMELRLTVRLGAVVTAGVAIFAALVKLF